AHDLLMLKQNNDFEESFDFFCRHIRLNKVYLETYRGDIFLSKEDMLSCKEFFSKKGMKVSGAITTTQKCDVVWDFRSFCYSNPEERKQIRDIVTYTAGIFDEIILDDFYFTNCKCDLCIKAKGNNTWSEFRTQQLAEVSREIVKAAKEVNPKINMIIKYPNWYDHYQFTGYTPKDQAYIFDSFYTGTETRDSQFTQQVLQKYHGYFIMRYLESINPGKNMGGWFDTFNCSLDAYVEQLNLTVFSKAREITLFCAGLLAYDYKICVPLAGFVFEELDKITGKLGNPVGIPCYKPFNSGGEDYIHGYLGMLGLPLLPCHEYPGDGSLVLLTESAAADNDIISKIKNSLLNGQSVMVTSGLLRALGSKISDIADIYYTNSKALVKEFAAAKETCAFRNYYYSPREILLPHIDFKTNDSWQKAVAIDSFNNHPVLLENRYSRAKLYVLTIPDNYGDIYCYPEGILNTIRETASADMPVHIEGPSNICLFAYDNSTFIVESFRDMNTDITISVHSENAKLSMIYPDSHYRTSPLLGTTREGRTYYDISLRPSSYKVFRIG
ncbi:MAG TPA: hypothetical protein VHP38_14050, partial [Ruminiclostridium sp.]|nr:hypothetical protein [Ruminiclostridium sp.]